MELNRVVEDPKTECLAARLWREYGAAQEENTNSQRKELAKQKCADELKFTGLPILNITESFINDSKTKCFVACVWTELGAVNEDKSFNVTKFIEASPDARGHPEIVQRFNDCSSNKDPDVCETAYKFYTCFDAKGAMN